ncbi:urea ABC transporter ATP-binding subunit UrtE [Gordonia sp. Z-3]|uniref:urea ABC transporter ATP-binding subunit UrtE n=1 Tax=Gordonia sp. Z-3 TaxID=3115408 RepID=UPI002E2C77B4|nr:urea ABC transporter ATP-binding subunit UrtE [Gordonia sp. Z-3]MED5803107.1 urea ABC transporter ATP-binding subunit UrtE [Gordonia sp. Z-3]
MLTLSGLTVGYGRTSIVKDLDLTVAEHSVTAVMGHNGAGKTTLLRACVGLLTPTAGRIVFDGEDITRLRPHLRVQRGIAYVPQGQVAFGQLTTAENLAVVAESHRRPTTAIDEVIDLFPALTELMSRRAGLLSGGQRQQLAIARALLTKPRLLILDEPTEGIQPNVVAEIESAIAQLTSNNTLAALLVEQHVGFALNSAERFYVIQSGRVVASGEDGAAAHDTVREAMAI